MPRYTVNLPQIVEADRPEDAARQFLDSFAPASRDWHLQVQLVDDTLQPLEPSELLNGANL